MTTAETAGERLYRLAVDFAEAFSNAQRSYDRADSATDEDRSVLKSIAETWRVTVARRREDLRAALRETLRGTARAVPDDELPVATTQRGRIEVRATTTDGTRTVRVRYTPAQALETGAALIACAALMDDRIGGTLTRTLAALPSHLDTEPATTEPTNEEPAGEKPTAEQPNGGGREIRDA
jgi:hypothetical protein